MLGERLTLSTGGWLPLTMLLLAACTTGTSQSAVAPIPTKTRPEPSPYPWSRTHVAPTRTSTVQPTRIPTSTPVGSLPPGTIYESLGSVWRAGDSGSALELFSGPADSRYSLSPDGTRLLLTEWESGEFFPTSQSLVDLASGQSRLVWPVPDGPSCPFHFLDENSQYIALTVRPDATDPGYNCWPGSPAFLPVSGGPLIVLDPTRASQGYWNVSPDGRQVAFDQDGAPRIFSFSVGSTDFSPASYGFASTPGLRFFSPSWSPDGQSIAWGFASEDWTRQGVAIFDLANGTHHTIEPLEVGRYEVCQANISWSNDATYLAISHCEFQYMLISDPQGQIVYRQDGYSRVNWAPVGNSFIMSNYSPDPFSASGLAIVEQPQATPRPIGQASFVRWLDPSHALIWRDNSYYVLNTERTQEVRLSIPEKASPLYLPPAALQ